MTGTNHTGGSQSARSNCASCHAHDDAAGSWDASAICTDCHGQPPVSLATQTADYIEVLREQDPAQPAREPADGQPVHAEHRRLRLPLPDVPQPVDEQRHARHVRRDLRHHLRVDLVRQDLQPADHRLRLEPADRPVPGRRRGDRELRRGDEHLHQHLLPLRRLERQRRRHGAVDDRPADARLRRDQPRLRRLPRGRQQRQRRPLLPERRAGEPRPPRPQAGPGARTATATPPPTGPRSCSPTACT